MAATEKRKQRSVMGPIKKIRRKKCELKNKK